MRVHRNPYHNQTGDRNLTKDPPKIHNLNTLNRYNIFYTVNKKMLCKYDRSHTK